MERRRKNDKPSLPMLIAVLAVILVGLLIWAICLPGGEEPKDTTPETTQDTTPEAATNPPSSPEPTKNPDPTEDPEPTNDVIPTEKPEPSQPEVFGTTVETPYAVIEIPEQWKDMFRVECQTLDFGMDVVFYGRIGKEEYWLYTIHFGGADGIIVGVMESKDGYYIDVTAELSGLVSDNSWTQEQTDLYGAMQESVNDIIAQLKADPAFRE